LFGQLSANIEVRA